MADRVDDKGDAYVASVRVMAQALGRAFEALMGGDATLARAHLAELTRSQRESLFLALDLIKSIMGAVSRSAKAR